MALRPLAYESTTFYGSETSKLTPPLMEIPSIPILSSTFIATIITHGDISQIYDSPLTITTSPILFIATCNSLAGNISKPNSASVMRIYQVVTSFLGNIGALTILKVPYYYGI